LGIGTTLSVFVSLVGTSQTTSREPTLHQPAPTMGQCSPSKHHHHPDNRKVHVLSYASSRRINRKMKEQERAVKALNRLDVNNSQEIYSEELSVEELELPRLGIILTMLAGVYGDKVKREVLLDQIPSWKINVTKVFEADGVKPDLAVVYGIPYAIIGYVVHETDQSEFHAIPFVAFRSPMAITAVSTEKYVNPLSPVNKRERSSTPTSDLAMNTPSPASASVPQTPTTMRNRLRATLMLTRGDFHPEPFVTSKGLKVGNAHRETVTLYTYLRDQGLVTSVSELLAYKNSTTALVVGHGVGAAMATLLSAELAVDNSVLHIRKAQAEAEKIKLQKDKDAKKRKRKGRGAAGDEKETEGAHHHGGKFHPPEPTDPRDPTHLTPSPKKYSLNNNASLRKMMPFGTFSNLHSNEAENEDKSSPEGSPEQRRQEEEKRNKLYSLPSSCYVFLYGCPRVFDAVTARKLRLLAFFRENTVVRFICSGDIVPTMYVNEAEHIGEPVCYRTNHPDYIPSVLQRPKQPKKHQPSHNYDSDSDSDASDFSTSSDDDDVSYDEEGNPKPKIHKNRYDGKKGYWVRFNNSIPDLDFDQWIDFTDEASDDEDDDEDCDDNKDKNPENKPQEALAVADGDAPPPKDSSPASKYAPSSSSSSAVALTPDRTLGDEQMQTPSPGRDHGDNAGSIPSPPRPELTKKLTRGQSTFTKSMQNIYHAIVEGNTKKPKRQSKVNIFPVLLPERNHMLLYMSTLLTLYENTAAVVQTQQLRLQQQLDIFRNYKTIQLDVPVASDIIKRKLQSTSSDEFSGRKSSGKGSGKGSDQDEKKNNGSFRVVSVMVESGGTLDDWGSSVDRANDGDGNANNVNNGNAGSERMVVATESVDGTGSLVTGTNPHPRSPSLRPSQQSTLQQEFQQEEIPLSNAASTSDSKEDNSEAKEDSKSLEGKESASATRDTDSLSDTHSHLSRERTETSDSLYNINLDNVALRKIVHHAPLGNSLSNGSQSQLQRPARLPPIASKHNLSAAAAEEKKHDELPAIDTAIGASSDVDSSPTVTRRNRLRSDTTDTNDSMYNINVEDLSLRKVTHTPNHQTSSGQKASGLFRSPGGGLHSSLTPKHESSEAKTETAIADTNDTASSSSPRSTVTTPSNVSPRSRVRFFGEAAASTPPPSNAAAECNNISGGNAGVTTDAVPAPSTPVPATPAPESAGAPAPAVAPEAATADTEADISIVVADDKPKVAKRIMKRPSEMSIKIEPQSSTASAPVTASTKPIVRRPPPRATPTATATESATAPASVPARGVPPIVRRAPRPGGTAANTSEKAGQPQSAKNDKSEISIAVDKFDVNSARITTPMEDGDDDEDHAILVNLTTLNSSPSRPVDEGRREGKELVLTSASVDSVGDYFSYGSDASLKFGDDALNLTADHILLTSRSGDNTSRSDGDNLNMSGMNIVLTK
jgi:hypothetical protein